MQNRAARRTVKSATKLGTVVAVGALVVAGSLAVSPANAGELTDAPGVASVNTVVSAEQIATPDNLATPDKGGTGAVCGRLTLNARLHSKQCNPRLATTPIALSRCTKLAIGVGATAATVAAVTTTPLDWPGITLAGTVTYLGTKFFCEVDFE